MTITVTRPGAFATVQDSGRIGFRQSGVPRSGAMDTFALQTLNALLGNSAKAAGIEWALTGGELEVTAPCAFAIGGSCEALLNGKNIDTYQVHRASARDVIEIKTITAGRFIYLSIAGGFHVTAVMGSRSTYLPGAFGGIEGRRLKAGDSLSPADKPKRRRPLVTDRLPIALQPPLNGPVRIITRESPEILLDAEWKISSASDRTGYRLEGTAVLFGASITSEPVCPGVIQLPPSGEPIILMADAPTVGGYRVLGAVASVDLGVLAQMLPGAKVQFESVTVEAAQRAVADAVERIDLVRAWALA